MIRFKLLTEEPLYAYKEACKITQGIDLDFHCVISSQDETKYWIKQIVANHSTIRCVRFRMTASAPKSVVMQIIRATKGHPQPYVQSSRPDWCGKERSADPYEEKLFIQDHTAESFIEMAKQRLCVRTEERTRKFMQEAVQMLINDDSPFLRAVGFCCKPQCYWFDGCPELKGCGKVSPKAEKFIDEYKMWNGIN